MGKLPLQCFLISAVLLFRKGFCALAEDAKSTETYGINGTYLYLNTSSAMHSNLPECPQNISIQDDAIQNGQGTSYSVNLASLNISTNNCIYQTQENAAVELWGHTLPSQWNVSMKNYTRWNMTIPENILKCLPDKPEDTFSGGNVSFLPFPEPYAKPKNHNEPPLGMEEMVGNSDYILVLENAKEGQACPLFPEARYMEMKLLIESGFNYDSHGREYEHDGYGDGDDEMKIGKGKFLRFCPVCSCQEKLGDDLDLEKVEMSEDNSTETSTEVDKDVHWRPPKVLVRDHKCPVNYSKRLEDVIGEDPNTERDEDDESYKESQNLALRAIISKLFDEIKDEFDEEWDEMDFEMRKEMVFSTMMQSFRRRRVMIMRRGAKCKNKGSPISKDTVFLYEKKHILWQLEHDPFLLRNAVKVDEIRSSEADTEEAFTLHVLRKKTDGGFSACVLSNSRRACELLNSSEFCDSFKPLGSRSIESFGEGDDKPGVPSKPNKGSGGPPRGDENPPGPGDNGTNTIGGPGRDGDGDQTSDKPGDKTPPAMPGGNQTLGPSPTVSKPPGEGQGNKSPTPTPTPVLSSPSPSVSPSGSGRTGLCFPAEGKVELEDGRVIRMDELKVGDSIQDGMGGYSKVILFTHANKEVVSEFVRLETDGADIALSPQHYLPVNGKLMTAESVEKGNIIYVVREGHKTEAIVTKVERVWMRGLFNPHTVEGTLVVRMNGNGVVASAYTAGIEANIAHTLLVPLRMLSNLMGVVVPWSWLFKNGSDEIVRMLPPGAASVVAA